MDRTLRTARSPGASRADGASRGRPRARGRLLLPALAGLAFLGACGTPAPRPIQPEFDLRHPSATRRVEAVAATVNARDTTQVPALILLLDDDDDAVRLSAGAALRDLTGHDTGYRAFAPPEERGRQAEAWRTWWAARGGTLSPAPASAPASGTPTSPGRPGGPK